MGGKAILTEEQYTAALEQIVERDYFPDVASARARANAAAMGMAGLAPAPPPVAPAADSEGEGEDGVQAMALRLAAAAAAAAAVEGCSLDGFQRAHTTEEAVSFGKIIEADQARHRASHSWAFDNGSSKTLLLTTGETMSAERRRLMDAACAPKPRLGDERSGRVQTWKFRPRNGISFPPELESSRDICGLPPQSLQGPPALPLRLTVAGEPGSKTLAKLSRKRTRAAAAAIAAANRLPPKRINHAATRLDDPAMPAPPRLRWQQQHGQQRHTHQRQQRLVSMTPSPMPGAGGDSPMFTWGDVDGTPLLLDTDGGSGVRASPFHVAAQSSREQSAHRLESRQRIRAKRQASAMAAAAQKRSGGSLTQAAQSLARRMAQGGSASPFDSVRSSYSPSPKHAASHGHHRATTPAPKTSRLTPRHGIPCASKRAKKANDTVDGGQSTGHDAAAGVRGEGGKVAGSITDGLLA
jgi:protein DGCR14